MLNSLLLAAGIAFAAELPPPTPEEMEAAQKAAGNIECSCKISGTCEFAGGVTASIGHDKKECTEKLKRLLTGTKSVFKKGENPEHPDQWCKCEPIKFKKL